MELNLKDYIYMAKNMVRENFFGLMAVITMVSLLIIILLVSDNMNGTLLFFIA